MLIGGLQKSSLLDYPEKIAAILFTQGCNFRCGYCHNPELLKSSSEPLQTDITLNSFYDFLKTRQGKLDGVVITGGEPCLQNDLIEVIKEIKRLGFLVKLDTNGTFPQKIEEILKENIVDYFAMDIKAPLDKYHKITGTIINPDNIRKSIDLIMNSGVNYEFRTTVISSQLSFEDFENIAELIKGAKKYYLQKFVPSKIYNQNLINEKTYSNEDFEKIKEILLKTIDLVEIR
ncbi:MAG: anaerobic ribonucleoside-triphosphate reductase activating protein [Candidatus Gastranaerophilales bacterium]|nr:anaerobic ribonucleoside-triphosphate reductase activating protein [Candidatus Gastranaerophilales bacterium]